MNTTMLFGTLELGIIYAILSLGLYISFRVLDMPDLTVDSSFVTGAAVSAMLCVNGHAFLGLLLALIAGGCTGIITALLHTRLKIQMLLSGILSMLALYSINLKIMGGTPNIPLINDTTIFTYFGEILANNYSKIIIVSCILIFCLLILFLFLNTRLGFAIRATGNNEYMARAQGINTDAMKLVGLAISNSFVALSGAILAQYQSLTDIGMGVGIIVIGLASIMIGEVLFRANSMLTILISIVFGSIIYRGIIAVALQIGMPPTDLRLISAIIVTLALSIHVLKERIIGIKNRIVVTIMQRRRGI